MGSIFEKTFLLAKNDCWGRYILTTENTSLFSEAFRERIRDAKKKSGLTIEQVAEESGVTKNAVIRLLSNGKIDLKLNDCIALCRFFELSIDEEFGLCTPDSAPDAPQEILECNRKLELENVQLTATNEMQRAQICSTHAICYLLTFFCALLAVSLIVYLVIDSQITDSGIIRGGKLSVMAWAFIALIVASIIAAGFTILRIVRKENKEGGKDAVRKV